METRADISHEEYVQIATTPEYDGWLTGRFLLFRPEIDAIDGWRNWGTPENRAMTDAQRTLYAFCTAVYNAHRSGGIVDWFESDTGGWDEIVSRVTTFPGLNSHGSLKRGFSVLWDASIRRIKQFECGRRA